MLSLTGALLGLVLAFGTPRTIAAHSLRRTDAHSVDEAASGLKIRIRVDSNHPDPDQIDCGKLGADWAICGVGTFTIMNEGPDYNSAGWNLYFHSIRRILSTDNPDFEVTHLTGDLHKITPTDSFSGFTSGSTTSIPFVYEYWILFETDFMPRMWLESAGDFAIVPNTNNLDDVAGYADEITGTNWMRTKDSPLPQANVTTRFTANSDTPLLPASDLATVIVPTPLSSIATENEPANLVLPGVAIVDGDQKMPAAMIQAVKDRFSQLGIPINDSATGYALNVIVDCSSISEPNAAQPEGYTLNVNTDQTIVVGCDIMGAFYGLQSLASLFTVGQQTIATVEVFDAPRFPVRSLMVDVARNFHSKEAIMRTLDQMAAYKLNRLHFHLADDEGWRLEIPGLSDLTDVGSKRCFDLSETQCLLPQLGSGPDDGFPGSGFFGRNEFIEILAYATNRGIEVVPEFDMPGHARAAVVSMEARYKRLIAEGDMDGALEYRLLDPDDESVFLTTQFYDKHSQINVCMPGALKFVSKVVAEVSLMYQEAGATLSSWHFGGDEARNIFSGPGFIDKNASEDEKAGKGEVDMSQQTDPYEKSPVCQQFMADNGIEETSELIGFLAVETSKVLEKNGIISFVAWQDGVKDVDGNEFATPKSIVNFWETLFWGGATSFGKWAEKGYDIILSCPDYLYFDFPYENNPKERGYYWASRHSTLRKIFNFAPENLPQNAETSTDRDGNGFSAITEPLPTGKGIKDIIRGIQGQIWSETIRADEQMDYMAFPRLIALAERAWHKASWELEYTEGIAYDQTTTYVDKDQMATDWAVFANVLGQRELPKLDTANIAYRVPIPGAMVVDGKLVANIELPGIPIFLSPNGNDDYIIYNPDGDYDVCSADAPSAIAVLAGYPDSSHLSRKEFVPLECATEATVYDCDENNPCTAVNLAQNKVYFPVADPDQFIQCGAGEQCFVMDCALGTEWDQSITTCASKGLDFYLCLVSRALSIPALCP